MERLGGESSNSRKHIRRRTSRSNDYISTLPITIVLHILSFLPFKDWTAMSQVSRQWRYLWTHVQSLSFDDVQHIKFIIRKYTHCPLCRAFIYHPNQYQCRAHLLYAATWAFMQHVDLVIQRHSGCTLETFHLSLQNDILEEFKSKIDNWVHFAMTRNIEDLHLSFFNGRIMINSHEEDLSNRPSNLAQAFEFPGGPYAPSMLKRLLLGYFKFGASNFEVFTSLQTLCLMRVKVKDFSIGDLLSICPVLEDLSLVYCMLHGKYLECKKRMKIKRLSLINCYEINKLMVPIDLTAPNLTTLIIKSSYIMESTIRKARNLVDVTISINGAVADNVRGSIVGSLLCDLIECKTLKLSTWCIQVLPTGENLLESLPTPLYKLEHLSLELGLVKQELPGISCLLRSCPNLDCLTLEFNGTNVTEPLVVDWDMFTKTIPKIYNFPEHLFWELQTSPYKCLQRSLKTIRLTGFSGNYKEMRMIEFLLRNATNLENLEIHYIPVEMLAPIIQHIYQDYILNLRSCLHHLQSTPWASPLIKLSFIKMEISAFP